MSCPAGEESFEIFLSYIQTEFRLNLKMDWHFLGACVRLCTRHTNRRAVGRISEYLMKYFSFSSESAKYVIETRSYPIAPFSSCNTIIILKCLFLDKLFRKIPTKQYKLEQNLIQNKSTALFWNPKNSATIRNINDSVNT